MSAGQLCSRNVDTATSNESVYLIARRMHDRNVGTIVIIDDLNKPIGLITDRDLVVRVLGQARDPQKTPIGEVMSRRIKTITEETPVERALDVMRSGPFRRIPVVNENGQIVGILSIDDVLQDLAEEFRAVGAVLRREGPQSFDQP